MALKSDLEIAAILTVEDWNLINCVMVAWITLEEGKVTERQKQKFHGFKGKQQIPSWVGKTVVNLSSEALSTTMKSVLAKGLNFAVSQREIPVKDVICGVEMALRDLPMTGAEEVRSEVCRLLRTAELLNSNISRQEWEALIGIIAL